MTTNGAVAVDPDNAGRWAPSDTEDDDSVESPFKALWN